MAWESVVLLFLIALCLLFGEEGRGEKRRFKGEEKGVCLRE